MNLNDVLPWVLGAAGVLVAIIMFHVGKIKGISETFSHFASEKKFLKKHKVFQKGIFWRVVDEMSSSDETYYFVEQRDVKNAQKILIRKSDLHYPIVGKLEKGKLYELYPEKDVRIMCDYPIYIPIPVSSTLKLFVNAVA